MRKFLNAEEVITWIRKRNIRFVNARRVARNFEVSTKVAGYILKKLMELGYLKVYNKRRGRFIVYKVSDTLLT